MCRKCNQPIFSNLSRETERRIGAVVFWLTSPLWVAACVALWLISLPFQLIAAGVMYGRGKDGQS